MQDTSPRINPHMGKSTNNQPLESAKDKETIKERQRGLGTTLNVAKQKYRVPQNTQGTATQSPHPTKAALRPPGRIQHCPVRDSSVSGGHPRHLSHVGSSWSGGSRLAVGAVGCKYWKAIHVFLRSGEPLHAPRRHEK